MVSLAKVCACLVCAHLCAYVCVVCCVHACEHMCAVCMVAHGAGTVEWMKHVKETIGGWWLTISVKVDRKMGESSRWIQAEGKMF